MKRLTALAALLLAAAAAGCTTTTDNTNTGAGNANNTNSTANANAAPSATPAGPAQADIEAKERQVWDAMKSKNWGGFAALAADDFVWVTSDGVHNKSETVEGLKKYDLTEYNFSDTRLVKVDEDLAALVYTSTEKSTYDGKPTGDKPLYNATAWAKRGGNWVAVYHQDTMSAPPPAGQGAGANSNTAAASNANAAPGTNANAAAPATPSPAAAPATATDAERAVWDALKAGNFTAFENFLAPGALEIEPEGVFNRSQSVEGVKQVNFARVTLSEFKETKLDADSTLVSYLVKSLDKGWPPAGMRHSTLWNNRGGKWQAYFHQGTTQEK